MIYTSFDDIPRKHYGVVYADPAWHHRSYSVKGQARSPSRHYKTMATADIKAMPVGEIAAKNCHLMMWTTQPHLQQAFAVMAAWDFRYSSVFQFWVKLNPKAADQMFLQRSDFHTGMGFTTRKNVELLLLGRRGSPKRLRRDIPDLIIAARRQHSRKPDSVPLDIQRYTAGPYIELNARESREGWDSWGDEVDAYSPKMKRWSRPAPDETIGPPAPVPSTPMFPAEDAA